MLLLLATPSSVQLAKSHGLHRDGSATKWETIITESSCPEVSLFRHLNTFHFGPDAAVLLIADVTQEQNIEKSILKNWLSICSFRKLGRPMTEPLCNHFPLMLRRPRAKLSKLASFIQYFEKLIFLRASQLSCRGALTATPAVHAASALDAKRN